MTTPKTFADDDGFDWGCLFVLVGYGALVGIGCGVVWLAWEAFKFAVRAALR